MFCLEKLYKEEAAKANKGVDSINGNEIFSSDENDFFKIKTCCNSSENEKYLRLNRFHSSTCAFSHLK